MNTMYKSSAYSIKHRLEAQIKGFQLMVDACNEALKCVHPSDTQVKNSHITERNIATGAITVLMAQLDANKKDILSGMD